MRQPSFALRSHSHPLCVCLPPSVPPPTGSVLALQFISAFGSMLPSALNAIGGKSVASLTRGGGAVVLGCTIAYQTIVAARAQMHAAPSDSAVISFLKVVMEEDETKRGGAKQAA